ncbi:HAD hydrolase-like protein [filamentous cyanobacterium LEGE 11480]|uniref:HAD hydrolase-like protein n=1 Tax=Romeriopsis navalis LEGE 11480 TaxID=2777977 RepID=A0A928VN60_9CYAN|nr:HAD hydrolase-like protein [Romeriopsis navalis]MBE9030758.1 HAD hydrolase-like protein [Romeriopsis navalis LEGE 11480]
MITPARKSVVFDFDGTIADSFGISLTVGNQLAQEYGIDPVTPEKLERWRHMSSHDILKEVNLPLLQLPIMLHRFKAALQAEINNFPFILGMRETILELWDQDYILGVVTSNSAENVQQFLNHQGMGHLFEFVESCPYYMGKQHVLKRIARQHQLDRQQMIYVGDETRDVDAAKKFQVQSVAVTWGFNSPTTLSDRQPDHLIDHPRELLKIAAQIN